MCDGNNLDCTSCQDGYGVNTNFQCQTCLDANCKECGEDFQNCNTCNDGYIKNTSGDCDDCIVSGCSSCVGGDPETCKKCS